VGREMVRMRSRAEAKKAAKKKVGMFKKLPKADATLLIDADIFAYQCVGEHLQEVEVRTGEWSYVLNMKDAQLAMEVRIEETMRNLRADAIVLACGSQENWRTKGMPEYKANR